MEIETDQSNVMWIKVDRKRKIAATSLLRAFGYEDEEQLKKSFVDVNKHPQIDFVEATLKRFSQKHG